MKERPIDGPPAALRDGDRVEYVGKDLPDLHVWQGHPGVVIDTPPSDPKEVVVSLVAGPSFCFREDDVQLLDDASYRLRGERIIAGRHPIAEWNVGEPLTAEGSHRP
jgi:hypothetical protein